MLVTAGCGRSPGAGTRGPGGRCNGAPSLCERRYDAVAYPTAHNAMSNEDDGWLGPNQHHGIGRALADGVRGLMIDTHYDDGKPFLCHGFCELGKEPLADGLAEIRAFVESNPGDVVTILFESHITPADTEAAVLAAGLGAFLHTQVRGQPWPTLGEMLDAGHRLVIFTETDGGAPAWYHDLWAFAWETPFHFEKNEEFTCAKNRGAVENSLFILNHFITNPIADVRFAEEVNVNPLFIERAEKCRAESGRLPNFVTVDFYDVGDLFAVTAALNGIE